MVAGTSHPGVPTYLMEISLMNKHSIKGITAAIAMATASLVHARAADDKGWYGSLNLGRSHLGSSGGGIDAAFAGQGLTASSAIDTRTTGFSLGAGYRINRNFAAEASFVDLGRFDYRSGVTAPAAGSINGKYEVHGFGLSAVGIVPLQQGFSVYGKAGLFLARTELEAASTGAIAVSRARSHEATGAYGLGASYDFTRNIAGKVEWNRYARVGESTTGRSDIDLYTVGVAYKF